MIKFFKGISTIIFTIQFLAISTLSFAQKEITVQDVLKWNRITESIISDNGSYIAVKLEPWKGASTIKLYNNKGKELFSADSSSNIQFAGGSDFLLFKKEAKESSSLNLYSIKKGAFTTIDSIKTFNLGKSNNAVLVVHNQDSTLFVGKVGFPLKSISSKASAYTFSKNENAILIYENCKTKRDSTTKKEGAVIKYLLSDSAIDTLWKGKEPVSLMALSEDGTIASFVAQDKLFVKESSKPLNQIASGVSTKRELLFSQDGSKLYFGLKVEQPKKDTTVSKEDFPEVNIWNWNEEVQFTQQLLRKKRDLDASNLALYNFEKESWFQITNNFITNTQLVEKGNSSLVVALSDKKYLLEQMWTGRSKYDIHIIDTYLERGLFALEGIDGMPKVSPAGKFLFWYSAPDSAWFTYSLENKEKFQITNPKEIAAYDETNDIPDWPSSYSFAGWSEQDTKFLIYDRYDIWAIDPFGKASPVNLTQNGRENRITYRYISTNLLEESIDLSNRVLLSGFDNTTKGYGYYSVKKLDGNFTPELLYGGEFMLNTPIKAKENDSYIFTKETFELFPDILFTNNDFKKITPITKANPQQKEFIWGNNRLVKWTSLDGIELEGVLYLPDNFDPSIKYPMVVNFYQTNSHNLFSHRIPEAHRSTIDYHTYNSSGYIIFNPDVVYKDGYPGESAFNAVMPGIAKVIEMGFVNPKKIGAQGHSWGGYQVAYLATRTNLFAAIESGAPVVNMFSAYGGIRWGSGLNRSFQYEHQQSRIGATPWESPLRYIENSPLFTMDKVTTPILIMHNDNDGHVPWYQGIEYFVALKRLRKPVWMLNYTGEIHWPQKMKNKVDFQIRMKQFFDHYLKDAPAPKWMEPGISAIELDVQTGY